MKKILFSIVAILFMLPIVVSAQEKVKVYIFEAGGCPYCEAQIEYLEGLDSYNEKFTIVKKEAYIDHIDWEKGKDYDLAKTVAEDFQKAGFEDATHQATPFIVISDKYAAAAYNTSLESVIDEVYEEGDKDIVGCYSEGNTDCLDDLIKANTISNGSSVKNNKSVIITIIISAVLIIATYIVKSTFDTKKIIESFKESNEEEIEEEEEVNEK